MEEDTKYSVTKEYKAQAKKPCKAPSTFEGSPDMRAATIRPIKRAAKLENAHQIAVPTARPFNGLASEKGSMVDRPMPKPKRYPYHDR